MCLVNGDLHSPGAVYELPVQPGEEAVCGQWVSWMELSCSHSYRVDTLGGYVVLDTSLLVSPVLPQLNTEVWQTLPLNTTPVKSQRTISKSEFSYKFPFEFGIGLALTLVLQ